MKTDQKNPFYPIKIDDYPQIFDYVPTKQGLVYLQTLKRKYLLGKEMTSDEYNKLRLLYVYYATANRNANEVYVWQDICSTLDSKGIFENDMFYSKESLKNQSLIVKNPQYHPGLYRSYVLYSKKRLNSKK